MGAESMNDDAPSRQAVSKRVWTSEENDKLVETVQKYGPQRWSLIATHLPGRVAKQCRERWFNHCCPEVSKGDWTEEEDRIIAQGVAELGTKWSAIVKRLPGRTDNAIKNRYNSQKRRDLRAAKREGLMSVNHGVSKLQACSVDAKAPKPMLKRARTACELPIEIDSNGEDASNGEEDCVSSDEQQRKRQRQRVIDLATKLVAETGDDSVRESLMQQLMDEAVGYARRAARPRTDEPPCEPTGDSQECMGNEEPQKLDLEQSLDVLFSDSYFSSDNSESGDEASERESEGDCERNNGDSVHRLDGFRSDKLTLSLEGNGGSTNTNLGDMNIEEMFGGEVMLTHEGAEAITPCAKASAASDFAEHATEEDGDSWLALYKPEVRPNSSDAKQGDEQNVLLPVLTPSNTKLCAALLDAFLPLQ